MLLFFCLLPLFFGTYGQECILENDAHGHCSCKATTHHDAHGVHGAKELLDPSGGPILCFVGLTFFLGIIARRWIKAVPYTVQLFAYGLILGQIAVMLPHHHEAEEFIGVTMAEMHPRLMMALFLPILLFEGAFFIHLSIFRMVSNSAGLLAGPGCMATTVMMAVAVKLLYPNWSWANAALLGAIVSPTDPIAMLDAMKEAGACKWTSAIIEGEDMLNDSMAILMFTVLMDYHSTGDFALSADLFTMAVWLLLGGPLFGWFCGRAVTFILRRSFNDVMIEATATLAGAFLCYYIAEVFLRCSGVLSMVAYGLVLNHRRSNISPEVEHFVDEFWHIIIFFAKTLIFILEGIHTRLALATAGDPFHNLGKLFLLFLAMNAARFIFVFMCLPLFNLSRNKLDCRHAVLLSFSGIRGDIPLALVTLVSTVDTDFIPDDVEKMMTYHVGGLVMLSILFNGLLSHKVIHALGISDVPVHRRFAMQRALRMVTLENDRYARMLQGDPVLADAPWDSVEYETAEKLAYPWHQFPEEDLTYADRLEISRLQVLRALRIQVWKMYHDGVARQATIRRLTGLAERALHEGLTVEEVAWHVVGSLMDLHRSRSGYWMSKLLAMFSFQYERPRAVFSAYDVGFTFVQALQAVQEHLHHLCVDNRCVDELKYSCLGALSIVRQRLQFLDVEHPKVTQSIKLRGAARLLLNSDRRAVQSLMHHGLIDEDDGELLIHRIEKFMVRLKHLPISMSLSLPEQILSATSWFQNLTSEAQARLLACDTITTKEKDCIQPLDTVAQGLGLVVHGVVRVTPAESDEAWYLGPGQSLNVLSVISGEKCTEGLHAQSSRVTFYWFPLELIQSILKECPLAKQDLKRSIAVRLTTHTMSRYLPYALWGKSKVMAAAERGWLLDLQPSALKRRPSVQIISREPTNNLISHNNSPPRLSNLMPSRHSSYRTSTYSITRGLYRKASTSSLCHGSHSAIDFPRPQPVLPGDDGDESQVLVEMVPQYEYILLYGMARFSGTRQLLAGPCLLHSADIPAVPDALIMAPTAVSVSSDSWVVMVPKYDEVDDEEEEEDDPRGIPLSGGRDMVDYAMDGLSANGEATHNTIVSYVTRLITSRASGQEGEGGRMPLLDNLGHWKRTSRHSLHGRTQRYQHKVSLASA